MKKIKKDLDAKKSLIASKKIILNHLKRAVKDNPFNYRTFGMEIEDFISEILIEIFKKYGFIKNKKDYKLAPNKNYFPDFELKTRPLLAIDYKSGNMSKLSAGQWVSCKNSNNDMGTFNSWPKKIKKFGGGNIYYIFVIYDFNNRAKEIIDVQIAPFYKLIGLQKNGLLKYREKDGNLRPKDFYQKSLIKNLKQFDDLLLKTIAYRSKRIIKKHRAILKSSRR